MCGRFVASRPLDEVVEQFGVEEVGVPPELIPAPRFNISPQDDVLAVREAASHSPPPEGSPPRRRLSLYRWGLVPSWAKDPSIARRAFNARAESLADRAMFRAALSKRRCLIPADAFYEWQRLPSANRRRRSQPWCFRQADGEMIAFAGLYERWHDDSGKLAERLVRAGRPAFSDGWLRSCTLVTTEANALMAPIHDRMPAVLARDDYEAWLAPGPLEAGHLAELLSPPPDDFLVAYKVAGEVGVSRAEGPQLAEPLSEGEEAPTE